MCEFDKKEKFLIEEYKYANELTFQMDTLRNKLTSFFITFAGIAVTGLILLLKNDSESSPVNIEQVVSFLLIFVSIIGHLFIIVLAKIRKIQIEYFSIINNIRKKFYGTQDYTYWNIIKLSDKTLPKPRLFSGTHFWLLIIQVLNSTLLFFGIYLQKQSLEDFEISSSINFFILFFLLSVVFQNIIYFLFASKLKKEKKYDNNYKPINN